MNKIEKSKSKKDRTQNDEANKMNNSQYSKKKKNKDLPWWVELLFVQIGLPDKLLLKILKAKNVVIALGGGAFMNEKIRSEVLKSSTSVWLKVSLGKLINRYRKNNRRPLLNRNRLETDVKKIYKERKKIYSLASLKIDCDDMNKDNIVQKILEFYEN